MDFQISETTLLQSRRIFLILVMLCKEFPEDGYWVFQSIQMITTADQLGLYYLVRLNFIDFNQKVIKLNIDRHGIYTFIEDLNNDN